MSSLAAPDREFLQTLAAMNGLSTESAYNSLLSPLNNPDWYYDPTEVIDGHFVSLNIGGQTDCFPVKEIPSISQLPKLSRLAITGATVTITELDLSGCRLSYLHLNYLTKLKKLTLCEWLMVLHINTLRRLERLDLSLVRYYPLEIEVLKDVAKAKLVVTELQQVCTTPLARKRSAEVVKTDEREGMRFLDHYNWDCGLAPLQWLAEHSPSKAVALRIYWMCRPEWYTQYEAMKDIPTHEREGFRLKSTIESNYVHGKYEVQAATFDPRNDDGEDWTDTYPELEVHQPLPPEMFAPVG